ncbi:hypothetical protein FPHYL_6323 [Fusarium phyllophilum]|uniref:Uncharacterized protein n=1 Tax=Fusarium phyllophilum TaxID=47803 RepID=A0A8H5JSW4_9HYPO|nr:hypothetical protein FPHYL_6323 [Fusarium phyllophilum]
MLPVGISVSVGLSGSWDMGQRASEQWKWNSNNKAGRAWVLLVRAGDGAGWSCAAGAGTGTGTGTGTGPGARSGAPRFLLGWLSLNESVL